MSTATETFSGKTHRDENFPVASWLLGEQYRGPILAFYRFARAADDVADDPALPADQKLARLDALGAALGDSGPHDACAEPLRRTLRERGLSPRHALDLLDAFRLDARKNRYADWNELMDYCRLSAIPVGRFVLDVHGEDQAIWPGSDALCAALQIINHLQDCGEDYRNLNRVYLPEDVLARHGASVEMLDAAQASPALLAAIAELANHTRELTEQGAVLVPKIANVRLGIEIAAIQNLARHLARGLESRDPLSQPVHLGKAGFALVGGLGVLRYLAGALPRAVGIRSKVRP